MNDSAQGCREDQIWKHACLVQSLLNKEMHFSLSCVLGFPVQLFLKVKANYWREKKRLKFSAFIHKMYLKSEDFLFHGRLVRKEHWKTETLSHSPGLFKWHDIFIYFCKWGLNEIITKKSNKYNHTLPRVTDIFLIVLYVCPKLKLWAPSGQGCGGTGPPGNWVAIIVIES